MPQRIREEVIPSVWARRIGRGVSDGIAEFMSEEL